MHSTLGGSVMFRLGLLLGAVAAPVLVLSHPAMAQLKNVTHLSKGIKFGEKFEGEFAAKHKLRGWSRRDDEVKVKFTPGVLYQGALPIRLKAGQGMSITATVVGQGRLVGIRVINPMGKRIREDPEASYEFGNQEVPVMVLSAKTAEITIEEVNATGKYTIIVVSDQAGPFTVKATSGSEGDDRESLEKQLKELKKKVAEIEAKLKALDKKPRKK